MSETREALDLDEFLVAATEEIVEAMRGYENRAVEARKRGDEITLEKLAGMAAAVRQVGKSLRPLANRLRAQLKEQDT